MDSRMSITIVLLVAMVTMTSGAPYDRNTDCPARAPHLCTCTEFRIDCYTRQLSSIPTFRRTGYVFETIDLANNNISRIPDRAFFDVNVTAIILTNNRISTIEPDAFVPLQKQITLLDLRNNRITFLPDLLSKLDNLAIFDVSYNPIPPQNFTNDVMREIGDYVTEFRFGDPSLTGWPQALHHLPRLEILKFYGGSASMERIPITAFSGFEWTLKKLWIQNTNLISTPIALQDLKSTKEFHFDNNPRVGDAGILVPAFAGLTNNLQILSLENNGLTTFPPVLRTLNFIHNLSLARNNLQFVSDEGVSVVESNLTTLNLQACNLDRIPGALSRLRHLENLDFAYNNITSIEKNDLQLMGALKSLNVSHNPLQYVSNSTFHDLINTLEELVLQETFMIFVPEAISKLNVLKRVDLTAKVPDIECNCDLIWLFCYIRDHPAVRIQGECYTIDMPIQDYAVKQIPITCPVAC